MLHIFHCGVADAVFSDLVNPWATCTTTVGGTVGGLLGFCKAEGEVEVPQPIRVFGAGLSKTGTSSLRDALNEGYKTYHARNMVSTPGHLDLWHEAATTSNIAAVLDKLADDGFNATTDLPMAGLFREGLRRYPQARFVLTLRDSPDKWASSFEYHGTVVNVFVDGVFQWLETFRKAKAVVYWQRTLLPFLERGECFIVKTSREKCIASYEQHSRDVIDAIPPEQLLVFNVKQGYAPLCSFLDIPPQRCPAPFPHANDRTQLAVAKFGGMLVNVGGCMLPLGLLFLCWLCAAPLPVLKTSSKKLQ